MIPDVLSANRKLAGTGFPEVGMPLQAQTAKQLKLALVIGSAPVNLFYSEEAGAKGLPPLSPAPQIPAPPKPSLRSGRFQLTMPNTSCTIITSASLRSDCCSPSLRNAVRLPTGIGVCLHRNTQLTLAEGLLRYSARRSTRDAPDFSIAVRIYCNEATEVKERQVTSQIQPAPLGSRRFSSCDLAGRNSAWPRSAALGHVAPWPAIRVGGRTPQELGIGSGWFRSRQVSRS